jgi:hypothetical protein
MTPRIGAATMLAGRPAGSRYAEVNVLRDSAAMVLASGMGGKAMAMWIMIAVIIVVLGGGSILYSAQARKKREVKDSQLKG